MGIGRTLEELFIYAVSAMFIIVLLTALTLVLIVVLIKGQNEQRISRSKNTKDRYRKRLSFMISIADKEIKKNLTHQKLSSIMHKTIMAELLVRNINKEDASECADIIVETHTGAVHSRRLSSSILVSISILLTGDKERPILILEKFDIINVDS